MKLVSLSTYTINPAYVVALQHNGRDKTLVWLSHQPGPITVGLDIDDVVRILREDG